VDLHRLALSSHSEDDTGLPDLCEDNAAPIATHALHA
jgi:hypothetical protein